MVTRRQMCDGFSQMSCCAVCPLVFYRYLQDLKQRVCGDMAIDADVLERNTQYECVGVDDGYACTAHLHCAFTSCDALSRLVRFWPQSSQPLHARDAQHPAILECLPKLHQ
jgi:hypothetical protein